MRFINTNFSESSIITADQMILVDYSILNKDKAVGQKMVPEALMLPCAPDLIRGLPLPPIPMSTVPQPDIVASESALTQRSQPKKAERMSTGVYYDNREVQLDMHPLHIRFSKVYTSVVPRLPLGKPMPQPPRTLVATNPLPSVEVTNENLEPTVISLATEICDYRTSSPTQEATLGKKYKLVSEETKEETWAKRQRVLSKDQLTFLEAALALSELGAAPPKPSPSTSSYKSPKSILLALPPPPFLPPKLHA
jgi:hypothetical protein